MRRETPPPKAWPRWSMTFKDAIAIGYFTPAISLPDLRARYPDLKKATPVPAPGRCCSSCAIATGQDACGDPVRVGLSDLAGVIRYHPEHGENCRAWDSAYAHEEEAAQ